MRPSGTPEPPASQITNVLDVGVDARLIVRYRR
jgi:hypothetical protein